LKITIAQLYAVPLPLSIKGNANGAWRVCRIRHLTDFSKGLNAQSPIRLLASFN
jgi:hypothetical protein